MSTALKSVISRQIPEFVRADDPIFVEFLQAYYEFLDQSEKRNLEDIRDIDKTLDEFVKYFKDELDLFGTQYPYIDQRLFLRKVKQLFVAKGTESAYKFLFKIMYDKTVDIQYPWDQVLKASDGHWQQEMSMFVNITNGDANFLAGNNINVVGSNVSIRVFVSRIKQITDTVYEVFITKNYSGEIQLGYNIELVQNSIVFNPVTSINNSTNIINHVAHGFQTGEKVYYTYTTGVTISGLGNGGYYYIIKVDDNSFRLANTMNEANLGIYIRINGGVGATHKLVLSVKGDILPTTDSYKVVRGGAGFKIGDLITGSTVSNGKTITQLLKVTRVDANGAIVAIATVQFGYGYTTDFFLIQESKTGVIQTSAANIAATKNSNPQYSIPDNSLVEQYQDYGYLLNPDYVDVPYSDVTYAGEFLQQFYQKVKSALGNTADFILISFKRGPLARYPGHYNTNDGFLDDDIYIQDSYKWQKYSYVLSVNEKLDAYKSIVKSLLHPAGTALFGEYQIQNSNNFDVGGKSTQVLGQWQSKATFTTVNVTLKPSYVYVTDNGGYIAIDPYDTTYWSPEQFYNPPVEYSFYGDARNIIYDTSIVTSDDGSKVVNANEHDMTFDARNDVNYDIIFSGFSPMVNYNINPTTSNVNVNIGFSAANDINYSAVFSGASSTDIPPGAVSDTLHTLAITNHKFITGDAVVYSNGGGTSITGLTDSGTYYVISINENSIKLASTLYAAINGGAISIRHGIGTQHSLTKSNQNAISYTNHPFVTGDAVVYSNGGGTSVTNLTNTNTYYIIKVDTNTIRLASTRSDALNGTYISIAPVTSTYTNKLTKVNSITIPNHSFITGNAVTYTGTTLTGLTNNSIYYIIVIDSNTVQIASSLSDANSGTPMTISATGTSTLTRKNTIIMVGHRFTTGDKVVYSQGLGGTSIGGLSNGGTYYVINNDSNSIKLATSAVNASAGTAITLVPSIGYNHSLIKYNTITIPSHGLTTGTELSYFANGNISVGGLINGNNYYAISVNANTISLASSTENATAGTAIELQATYGSQKLVYYT